MQSKCHPRIPLYRMLIGWPTLEMWRPTIPYPTSNTSEHLLTMACAKRCGPQLLMWGAIEAHVQAEIGSTHIYRDIPTHSGCHSCAVRRDHRTCLGAVVQLGRTAAAAATHRNYQWRRLVRQRLIFADSAGGVAAQKYEPCAGARGRARRFFPRSSTGTDRRWASISTK